MKPTVFLFGESERGEFGQPVSCACLDHLCDYFGTPPQESLGIDYAIQSLLYQKQLLFCRVREEGFSTRDYMQGLGVLKEKYLPQIQALFLPGVGNAQILEAATEICHLYRSILVITPQDLYDYLT